MWRIRKREKRHKRREKRPQQLWETRALEEKQEQTILRREHQARLQEWGLILVCKLFPLLCSDLPLKPAALINIVKRWDGVEEELCPHRRSPDSGRVTSTDNHDNAQGWSLERRWCTQCRECRHPPNRRSLRRIWMLVLFWQEGDN